MESNKVAQESLEGKKKESSFFPVVQGGDQEEAMAAAVSPAATLGFLAAPLSLLRHVAHGCAGYLGGLASRLKPAAACQPWQQEGRIQAAAVVIEEEEVVVQVRSRGMPPQRPRGLVEGRGGVVH